MAEEKTERENLIKEREKKEDLTYIMGLFLLKADSLHQKNLEIYLKFLQNLSAFAVFLAII